MKRLIPLCLLTHATLSNLAFALNPIQGFYGGGLATISSGPATYNLSFIRDGMDFQSIVNNSRIGGGGGLALGYRLRNFRVEGEFLYNYQSAGTLSVGSCTLHRPGLLTPTGTCPEASLHQDELGFDGSNTALYGMFNAYFDFYTQDSESSIVPFLGLGIGMARVKHSVNFESPNVTLSCLTNTCGGSITTSGGAAQGILGLSLFFFKLHPFLSFL